MDLELKVKLMKEQVDDYKEIITLLEQELRKEIAKLQKICTHDYVAEDNGDYHRSSYCYRCAKCDLVTNIKPMVFRYG